MVNRMYTLNFTTLCLQIPDKEKISTKRNPPMGQEYSGERERAGVYGGLVPLSITHREIWLQRIHKNGRGVKLRREGGVRIESVVEPDRRRLIIHRQL